MSTSHTDPTAVDLARIPADLKARPQWVLWRGADRIDQQTGEIKLDKIPYTTDPDTKADTTDPQTWTSFQRCVDALPVVLEQWEDEDPSAYRGGGVGFVFASDDPYCGVDLDHCVDPDTGTLEPWAQGHVDTLASYAEVSPSRNGIHIFVQGTLPPRGRKKGPVEMYTYARFFTMTGWHLTGTPTTIAARQIELTAFHTAIFGAPQATHPPGSLPQPGSTPLLEDTVILDKARAAKNGAKFTVLCSGDITGYGSQSEADLALCILLAFWTQDAAQIDRLFRQSGLLRDKWDEQRGAQTYGERTITEALARQTEHYTPRQKRTRDAQQRRNGHAPTAPEAQAADTPPEDAGASQLDERIYCTAQPKTRHPDTLPYSDYTNAMAFVRDHGDDIRYCHPWKYWLVWTGTHWQEDHTGAVMRSAKATIKRLAQHAEDLDDEGARALLKHVKASLATAKLKAMIESAQSEPGIPVLPGDLDRHPWLLNCANGTLDLKTGTLQPHNRTDLLTRSISTPYDPEASCSVWKSFLWRIMDRNQAIITFLQHAIGYSLSGDTREQCLFILWGSGANGKSTFVNTLLTLLGPYAMKATAELLMVTRNDRHPTERADLFGQRFVAAIETEEGGRLNEVFVKEATGGDPIRARRMQEDFWQFDPTHKVFLATMRIPVEGCH